MVGPCRRRLVPRHDAGAVDHRCTLCHCALFSRRRAAAPIERGISIAMLELLTDADAWAALVTLTALEIILGIDNIVFISVLTARLEADKARRARQVGLSLAFIFRVIMLAGLTWLMGLTAPLFTIFDMGISWRDIILIGGGLFLIAKATHEIHVEVEAQIG